ncbi:MAG: hypothetical protein CLLPBCKN_004503 [Chroococcidiopsis cubana SAG 39.79]|uniref:hypothetical protein n=1 Tax=Chroococcidiopsis cubana TaxID=171392 RepID=UPI002AC5C3B9|nr:hypothetical protein [Chroococcidiopsis cubana]MDZ4875107.1 hypothetical protein [Chroococcidiopsis cubana SAG 39.79]
MAIATVLIGNWETKVKTFTALSEAEIATRSRVGTTELSRQYRRVPMQQKSPVDECRSKILERDKEKFGKLMTWKWVRL